MAKYTAAFECHDCPESNDTTKGRACPCWLEIIETNVQTGEVRINKNCYFQLAPNIYVELIKASNRPAAAVESIRNEMVNESTATRQTLANGFSQIANVFMEEMKSISSKV